MWKIAISGAFFTGFLWFFLLNAICLAYETCLRSFARLRPAVVKLYGNWWKISAWKYLVRFLSVFFAKYDLFSLRNMPTNFREVAPSRCKVIWKLVEILNMEISGAFLIGCLWFFLLITIYLAYKTCLRSLARLCPAVVKLYGNWWKISAWEYLVRFLSVFLDFSC